MKNTIKFYAIYDASFESGAKFFTTRKARDEYYESFYGRSIESTIADHITLGEEYMSPDYIAGLMNKSSDKIDSLAISIAAINKLKALEAAKPLGVYKITVTCRNGVVYDKFAKNYQDAEMIVRDRVGTPDVLSITTTHATLEEIIDKACI